ncbi:MAG: sec-independent protein translocase protein TatA [Candidatus Marinimicrobia bacterium]|jgi:TatA/E family protein of Tat protein translocase|nr:sec-independent protein translocase protein TatA [Candidatus Neomarinimicrobiota bacterium]
MNFGPWELIIILVIILLIFGPKKLPELAKGLGKGLREFKKAAHDVQDELENVGEDEEESQVEKSTGKDDHKTKKKG